MFSNLHEVDNMFLRVRNSQSHAELNCYLNILELGGRRSGSKGDSICICQVRTGPKGMKFFPLRRSIS